MAGMYGSKGKGGMTRGKGKVSVKTPTTSGMTVKK